MAETGKLQIEKAKLGQTVKHSKEQLAKEPNLRQGIPTKESQTDSQRAPRSTDQVVYYIAKDMH